ncbi:alpha/beta hydrolase [Acinetobacter sp.]|uniref:RBBP9/YdeN family alpha/beta hydrolase n=1 Tax=Acinetobacter sp. TaxID=472 RepID=UPI00264734B3|nr:alpha/beta hydrolase [Acinetobacter sp.]MDN5512239.1 alpha/beta hydrolase [Acinetobacter sp.]MDN5524837.1 alpha/beta hydrolase [Acinetobacter sp.]
MSALQKQKKVFIVHGDQESPNDHWFPWLSQQVQHSGHLARRLILPDANAPDFQLWQQALQMQIPQLDQHSIIIAHSLGSLASLHFLSQALSETQTKGLILVAAFNDKLTARPELDPFIEQAKLNMSILQKQISRRFVLFSCNDPFVPPPMAVLLGHYLNAQMQEVQDAGHFMRQDGFTEFKEVWEILKPMLAS